jgi:hypothetical protein
LKWAIDSKSRPLLRSARPMLLGDRLLEAREHVGLGGVLGDVRPLPQEIDERMEGEVLPERERATLEPGHVAHLGQGGHLGDQARLADAGVGHHAHHSAAAADHRLHGARELGQLALAPDDLGEDQAVGRGEPGPVDALLDRQQLPRGHRLLLPLEREGTDLAVLELLARVAVRLRADPDGPGR